MDRRPPAAGADPVVSFGHWVRRRRLALDLTQAALARRVGCSTPTIKKLEHDERRPSRTMAERLAAALEVPEDDRGRFVAVGLAKRSADRLPPAIAPADAGEPAWLTRAVARPAAAGSWFVGRERELARLTGHLDEAVAGRGRVVFVAGEAGDGKTALLTAFAEHAVNARPDLLVARGYGTAATGHGDPYLPFRDLLLMLLADHQARWQADQLTADQARRLWAAAPAAARAIALRGPGLADALVPSAAVEARLLPGGVDALRPVASQSREQLFSQLTAVLHELADAHPLLLLIDDLQWVDAASAELLFHLVRRVAGSRMLLVGAYRRSEVLEPGDAESADVLRRAVLEARSVTGAAELRLDDAAEADARALCDALLDRERHGLGEAFRAKLFEQTGGHPLFVTELVRELRLRGELVRDEEGRWVERTAVDWSRLPDRLAAVVEQRLARLGVTERTLLDAAAVEGEHFTADAVAAATDTDPPTAYRTLARIARHHSLVHETGAAHDEAAGPSTYRFSHALFSQYLHDALDSGTRRHLHRAIARALETLHAAEPERVIARLAHHFSAAGDGTVAVPYLLAAGDRARVRHAGDEAVRHYERAAAFLREEGDHERLARTLMKLGLTHQTSFAHARAQAAFDEAFALWRPLAAAGGVADDAVATLRMPWGDPETLDPTMGGYDMARPVTTQLFAGLVTYGPDDEILPDVAERWTITDGGRCYTFTLRDDVFWSDGAPVTAHDFVATYRRALDPATDAPVAPSLLDAVRGARPVRAGDATADLGISAPDERTLVIELVEPTSYFIYNLAYYVLLPVPAHVVTQHGPDWATSAQLVSNGAFHLAEWESGRRLVLERNPRYHGSSTGNVGRVVLDLTAADLAARYAADEFDVLQRWFSAVELADLDGLRRRAPDEHAVHPGFVTFALTLDIEQPPLDDARVRRALSMALDRDALANVALRGFAQSSDRGGLVPPGMPGHVPDCGPPHDPEQAARLLADAGVTAAVPEVAVIASTEEPARVVRDAWHAVGLPCRVELVDPASRFDARTTHRPWALVSGWVADYPDPDNFLRVWVELLLPPGWHDRYRTVLDEAARSVDQAARLRRYEEAERLMAAEAACIPFAYEPRQTFCKPWVTRFPITAVKHPGFWKDVTIGA